MIVIDHEPQCWFLLQDGEALLLDVHCSHSAVEYSWIMALNSDEAAKFKANGRAFLDQLAESVQWSAPGVRGSTSPFIGRDLSRTHDQAVSEAVKAWRAKSAPSHG